MFLGFLVRIGSMRHTLSWLGDRIDWLGSFGFCFVSILAPSECSGPIRADF
jgi:hypothetical protein